MKRIVWILSGWLALTLSTYAASFDCEKAAMKVEHLICDNPDISKLDEDLSKAYSSALEKSKDKQTTIKEQRQWLKEKRNICPDADCLKASYASRLSELSNTEVLPKIARKTAKHVMKNAKKMDDFEPFVKEKEYLDDPFEIASPEAEKLLQFIENKLTDGGTKTLETWAKITLDNIKNGEGEYLKISDDVYLVKSGFVIRIADMRNQRFDDLASGYELEVVDRGVLADGTGWLLLGYGGLSHGISFEGNYLITFFNAGQQVNVASTRLIAENYGYSEDNPAVGSYEYWCGPKEARIKEIAGRIQAHEWQDIHNDGQEELIINVEEKDCRQIEKSSFKRRLIFSISKGQVNELH